MPTPAEIIVHDGPDDVAEALAARLTATLADVQARGGTPQVCLTGGGIATKAYARLAQDGPGDVDWSRVDLWWGDERFVPAGDADRNADGTLAVLRGPLRLDDRFVHVMPASDAGLDLDEAAAAYATELGDTVFDVCLLGMGPDGHVASLFPGHPGLAEPGTVIPVRNSPKPPPDRISVTMEVINRRAAGVVLRQRRREGRGGGQGRARHRTRPRAGRVGLRDRGDRLAGRHGGGRAADRRRRATDEASSATRPRSRPRREARGRRRRSRYRSTTARTSARTTTPRRGRRAAAGSRAPPRP